MIVLNSTPVSWVNGEAEGITQGLVASFMIGYPIDLAPIITAEGTVELAVGLEVGDFV